MRVLLDATAIPANRGGVGRYIDELLPHLDAAGLDMVLVCQARDAELFGQLAPQAHIVPAPRRLESVVQRLIWEQTGLPRLIDKLAPQVVHSPHYTLPDETTRWPGHTPVVVTLHDATFFTNPEAHLRTKAVFFRRAIRHAARRADALVVPSQATRDEVVRLVGAKPDRFVVAYHGVDHQRFHPVSVAEAQRVRASLDIGDAPYVGFLGTLEPRKNVPALIRGWVAACQGRDKPPALVLAGGKGWDADIDAAIAQVPAHLTIRRPGYLPLDDLPGFLAGARVLAYPSLGEGFGLPVLEAMACGATVLTTNKLSLPEVGGDAVAYCDTGWQSIGQGLAALLDDPQRSEALAVAGIARAAQFTWQRAAQDHIRAYQMALDSRA